MAYDKVVDSAVLDAGLKQIADAIREKGGTSDSLEFPDAMANAVRAIQAGGGEETLNGYKHVSGQFTLAEDTTSAYTVEFTPRYTGSRASDYLILVWTEYAANHAINNSYSSGQLSVFLGAYSYWMSGGSHVVSYLAGRTTTGNGYQGQNLSITRTATTFTIPFSTTSGRMGLAGHTYNWLIIPMQR